MSIINHLKKKHIPKKYQIIFSMMVGVIFFFTDYIHAGKIRTVQKPTSVTSSTSQDFDHNDSHTNPPYTNDTRYSATPAEIVYRLLIATSVLHGTDTIGIRAPQSEKLNKKSPDTLDVTPPMHSEKDRKKTINDMALTVDKSAKNYWLYQDSLALKTFRSRRKETANSPTGNREVFLAPQWGQPLCIGFNFGVGSNYWPRLDTDAWATEYGVFLSLRLFRWMGVRGMAMYTKSKTKEVNVYFEEDIIEDGSVIGIVRNVPENYKNNRIQLFLDLWFTPVIGPLGEVTLFLGGGTAFLRELTHGREYGLGGPETGYFNHLFDVSLKRKLPVFSTGAGYNAPFKIAGVNMGLEVRYKLMENKPEKNITTISDNTSFSHELVISLKVIR